MKESRTGLAMFRWGWTAFVVLATSVPYLLNWFSTPAGFHYTWIVPPYPEDSLAYMSWSQQAAHGSLLFQLKYTALPHAAFLFHPFFLVCGRISSLFACDIGMVHWAVKAVGVVLFLATFFRYADYLELGGFQSIVASILVGISSGMGGLFAFFGLADRLLIVPAGSLVGGLEYLLVALVEPAIPVHALTLILLAMYWLDRGTRDARKADFWFSGLSTGALALIHPYSLPLLFALAVVITVVRRRAEVLGFLCRYFLACAPFVLYVVLVAELHPLVSKHSFLGEMRSPLSQPMCSGSDSHCSCALRV